MVRGQTLYRVNAGGPQVTTGGNTWLADQPYNGVWGWVGNDYNTASVGSAIAGTTDPSLYQTNAYGYLSYIFPATCGDVYSVTLKFAETYWGSGNGTTGPGSRIFDVVINNNVVLTNFDIYSDTTGQATFDTSAKTTAGANIADDHVFTGITANAQGQIYIQLGPDTSDVAEVQAIQIDQTGTTPCLSTATNTPVATPTACSGGYIQQTEIPLTSDSVTYIALQSTADPAGWQAQGYSAAGWAHPFVWTASGYAPISAGVPWMSWQNSTTNGTTQWARQLVIHPFSLPANATNISASYTYASDDNMTTEINGVSVESENDTLMSYDTINTITVPVGVIQPGPAINVLTLDNENPQIVIMGYTFRLTINYEIPCPTLTNTPTNTSTSTPTNTLTNTVTNTDTNTATNTSTSTATNTVTNTMTSTTVFTATNTPTNTATNTVTNTATITVSNTVTNTSTLTATNTVTSTPTSTPTITNTPPPSATPTNTNTPGPTLTIQKKASESTAQAGDTITYDVLLSVSGSAASGILVQDTLPANVTFKGFENPTPGVTVTTSQNGGNLSWSFASLPVGTYDLPYQVTVNSFVSGNTPLFNQAWVTFGGGGPVTASCQVAITGQYTVKINIYNSSGEVVKTIPAQQYSQAINSIALQPGNVITTLQGPGSTLQIYFEGNLIATWDGTNNSQNPVMNGNYKIQVDNVSSTGEVTSVSQPAVVNRKLSNVTATIYNSAGEAVRTLFDVVGEANTLQMTNVDLSANVIDLGAVNGSATSLNIFVLTTGNAVTLTWDGSNNNETNVMPGTYEIELHWDNGQGQTMDISRSIIVTATGGVSGVVIARPNVLSSKDTMTTTFDGTSIANATTLNVRIYTVAGELVASPPASGAATATWNASGVASGIYIAVVKVEDANGGVVKQQSLKVLVLH